MLSTAHDCCCPRDTTCCPRDDRCIQCKTQTHPLDTILMWSCSVDSPQVPWTTPIPWITSRGTHFVSRGHVVWTTPIPWVTSRGELTSRGLLYMYPRDTRVLSTGCMSRELHPMGSSGSTDTSQIIFIYQYCVFQL